MTGAASAESGYSAEEFAARRRNDALLSVKRFRNPIIAVTLLALILVFALILIGEFIFAFAAGVVVLLCAMWLWSTHNHIKEIHSRPYGDPLRPIPDTSVEAGQRPTTSEGMNVKLQ